MGRGRGFPLAADTATPEDLLKLFMFPVAPNPTKVRLYIAEKRALGVAVDVEDVTVKLPKGETKEPAQLARNPFGTLPVLETRSGSNIWESLAIIEYLEELYPEPSLWGSDPESRVAARQAERMADLGVLIPIARIVHATDSPIGYPPNPVIAENFRERLIPRLEYLDAQFSDGRRPSLTARSRRPFSSGASATWIFPPSTLRLRNGTRPIDSVKKSRRSSFSDRPAAKA